MLTYHHLIRVMEYLREEGASQSALDDVLATLWEETESQNSQSSEITRSSGSAGFELPVEKGGKAPGLLS